MSVFGTVTCKLPRAGVQPRNGAQLGAKHVTWIDKLVQDIVAQGDVMNHVGADVKFLVDSGAYGHVCPPNFAPHVPVEYIAPRTVRSADVRVMKDHGCKHMMRNCQMEKESASGLMY